MERELRKKILLIIPNLGNGGAQQVFRQQFKYLSKWFVVTGCVFNWDGSFADDHLEGIFSLDVPAGRNIFKKAFSFLLRLRRLKKLKNKLRPDVSISHLEGADYVNIFSRTNEIKICWIHGTKRHDKNIQGLLGLLRSNVLMPLSYRKASKIVCVSQDIFQEFTANVPASRITVIHNGFDIDEINLKLKQSPVTELSAVFGSSSVVITHCRLARQKNLGALLHIFGMMKHLKIKLLILGDGELRDSLVDEAHQIGLHTWTKWSGNNIDASADVFFAGYQANPFSFLVQASLYVMTSSWEGFPLALGEAMACNLKVISADCPTGPRELLGFTNVEGRPVQEVHRNEYGVLMPLADPANSHVMNLWATEIEQNLSSDHAINREGKASDRIREFSLSKSIEQTVTLIREFVEK
jgi:glycosyltransferase involved in cell wall biosynthesis